MTMDEPEAGARPGWRTWAVVLVFYAASVAVATYPMVLHIQSELPSTVDPLQHLTVLRWYKTCLLEGRSPLKCPEIQYPVGAPIGNFSPLHFQALLFVPLSLIGVDDVAAFNLIWWFGFLFTGLGTFALAWHVVRDEGCAAISGLLAMLGAPMMLHSHGHLELITLGWFPLFVLAWLRFVDRPTRGRLAATVATYVLLAMSAAYFAVFAVFPAALYVAWRAVPAVRSEGWGWARRRMGWGLAFAAVAGGLVLIVFSGHVWAKVHGYSLGRPRSEFDRLGAPLWGYFLPTATHLLGQLMPVDVYAATGTLGEGVSYLGIVTLLLLHRAAIRRVSFPRANYWWAALVLLVVLSMGSHLRFGANRIELPCAWLWRYLFAFRLIRVPARFNLFAIVVAAVVAGAGLKDLMGWIHRNTRLRAGPVLAVLAVIAIADLRTGHYGSVPPPEMPAIYRTILRRDPTATFLEVPQSSSGGAEQLSAVNGYWQSIHRGASTGGYSGQPNARFDELMFWNSPFAYFHLSDPAYLANPDGEYVDLTFHVDFDDLAWLYLATHKLKYVVLHKWAIAVGERQMVRIDALRARLAPARIYEDDRTAVYESARLKPPTHPVLLCTEGWRQRVGWRGKLMSTFGREGRVAVYNPDPGRPLTLTLEAAALKHPRSVRLRAGGQEVASWRVEPGDARSYQSPPFRLPAGLGELIVESDGESTPHRSREAVAEGDARPYSLRVVGLGLATVSEVAARPGTVR